MRDLEKGLPEGYPSLANLMCQGSNNAVFTRFREMGTRVLLYKQSGINALRRELQGLDAVDTYHSGEDGRIGRKAAKDWQFYSSAHSEVVTRRRELMGQIEIALESYQNFLVLQSNVAKLKSPSNRSMLALKEWYTTREPKILNGIDAELYNDVDDMVALDPVEEDRLTLIVRRLIGWMFAATILDEVNGKVLLRSTSDGKLYVVVKIIGVLLSTALILGPTILLMALGEKAMWVKLGIVAAFIPVFTFVVGLLTHARRAELFAGTAAYAAVLVVFLSSTTSTS